MWCKQNLLKVKHTPMKFGFVLDLVSTLPLFHAPFSCLGFGFFSPFPVYLSPFLLKLAPVLNGFMERNIEIGVNNYLYAYIVTGIILFSSQ